MAESESINYLIVALNSGSVNNPTAEKQVLNNIVYFMPRIRNHDLLEKLIGVMFSWTPKHLTKWEWFEACRGILRWKLEISEPQIPIHHFISMWNAVIERCQSFTIYQLTNLAGFIACKAHLDLLQEQLFIDDSGNASEYMDSWKYNYFMPIWKEQLRLNVRSKQRVDDLCVLYSVIHSKTDNGLPSDILVQSLFGIIVAYITAGVEANHDGEFVYDNLNMICQTCELNIPHVRREKLLLDSLGKLCLALNQLSARETSQKRPRYNDKYFTNVLFSVVLLLSGYKCQRVYVDKMLMILFYSSFILEDFGVEGFAKYQDLIHRLCATVSRDFQLFDSVLLSMTSKLGACAGNKVNHAKLMFTLQYLEITLVGLEIPNSKYLVNKIEPLIGPLVTETDVKLRESSHVVWLAIFNNETWSDDINRFKLLKLRPYLDMCMEHYRISLMSQDQLLLIWKSLVPCIKYLSSYDNDLIRHFMHATYLHIINTENLDLKVAYTQCLIEQLYNVKEKYIWDWLDTCYELLQDFPNPLKDSIVTTLWEFVSHSHNGLAIRWWYDRIVPTLSRV